MKNPLLALRLKVGLLITEIVRRRNGFVTFFGEPDRVAIMDLIKKIRRSGHTRLLLSDDEAYHLVNFLHQTAKIPGNIAELGSYRGASAKLMAEAMKSGDNREIHLFDTFEGMPEVAEVDKPVFRAGQCVPVYDEVVKLLSPYSKIHLHKGLFPTTTKPVEQMKFSLVHLDPDIYESIKAGLEFFYPRMSSGGVILLHDYPNGPGVVQAINEFMADKPQSFFEAGWRQCFIVKP